MSEGDLPPLALAEASRVLGRLEEIVRKPDVILVGGQAVAIWVAKLAGRLPSSLTAEQVASHDLDFLGRAADAQRAADLLGGRVRLSTWEDHTPLAGVALFRDSDGIERRLDVLQNIYGLRSDEVRDTAIQAEIALDDGRQVPIWVMHPERCLESRVHNSALPNKQTELAYTQLRASILCARAFSQLLLDERAAVRDVRNLNERIFRFALRERQARRITVTHGIECFDAVLADERLGGQFAERRFPQMQAQIASVRQRDRVEQHSQTRPASNRQAPEPRPRPPSSGQ